MAPTGGPPRHEEDRSGTSDPSDPRSDIAPEHHEPTWDNLVSESSTFSLGLQQAIGRAVTDPAFRMALFGNPEAALSEFDMPDRERQAMLGLPPKYFESVLDGLRADLNSIMRQLTGRERQVSELAESWERMLMEILPGEDGLDDVASESGENGR